AFKGWRDSPEHNANLLMPQATRFGIAIAKNGGSRFGVFWAMEVAAKADGL
ncbi:MAG TPA: CAP domain-containing protein, partial [Roseiarcus sp.]|nr:CAP domain-containing protein [Roseiarcus sp.]